MDLPTDSAPPEPAPTLAASDGARPFTLPRGAMRSLGAFVFIGAACLGLYTLLAQSGPVVPTQLESARLAASAPGATPEPVVEPPPPAPTIPRAADWKTKPGFVVVEGNVGNRTVTEALQRAGLSRNEVARLIAAFGTRLDRSRPKDSFAVVREGKDLALFEYVASATEIWQATKTGTDWTAKKLDLPVTTTERARWLYLGRDLSHSLTEAGFEPELSKKLDDAFDGHVDLSHVKAGSLLAFVVREKRVDGRFAGYEQVDVAEITATEGPVRIYAFDFGTKDKPERGHFDANARQPAHGGWRMPIPFARVTSPFNPKRFHPVLKRIQPHNGIDFAGSTGTPIYSVAPGTISFAADSGACGNMVQITHPNGLLSSYCHMSRFAQGVSKGDVVQGHELIGYVGKTGRVTGPHLHFAVKKGGVFIDPASLKIGGFRVIPASQRAQFNARKDELDKKLDAVPKPVAPPPESSAEPAPEPVFEEEAE